MGSEGGATSRDGAMEGAEAEGVAMLVRYSV